MYLHKRDSRAAGILMEYLALMEYFFKIDDYIPLTRVDCNKKKRTGNKTEKGKMRKGKLSSHVKKQFSAFPTFWRKNSNFPVLPIKALRGYMRKNIPHAVQE